MVDVWLRRRNHLNAIRSATRRNRTSDKCGPIVIATVILVVASQLAVKPRPDYRCSASEIGSKPFLQPPTFHSKFLLRRIPLQFVSLGASNKATFSRLSLRNACHNNSILGSVKRLVNPSPACCSALMVMRSSRFSTDAPSLGTVDVRSLSRDGLAAFPPLELLSFLRPAWSAGFCGTIRISDFPASFALLTSSACTCILASAWLVSTSNKNFWDLTGCLDDMMCSANGPSTPGLLMPLAADATSGIAFQQL